MHMKNKFLENDGINSSIESVLHNLCTYFLIFQLIGIVLYIKFPNALANIFPIIAVLGGIVFFKYIANRHKIKKKLLLLPALALLTGIITMHLRTVYLDTKFIAQPITSVKIAGTVRQVKDFEERIRIVVDVKNYEDLKRIRVKTDKIDLKVGDSVEFYANLFPPPSVMLHDVFDFNFYFYFQGISAVGYATNELEVIKSSKRNNFIDGFRKKIEKNVNASLPKNNAAIINSLITGNANGLDKKLKEKIRNIGVAHVFAISGMHMGIIVSLSFFVFRNILKRLHNLSLHHNISKIAALIALAFGFFYLVVADFAISAQRAYIMCFIFLCSILFDRKMDLFRNLMLSGILMLLVKPECVVHPSMQMSFMACLGLIVVFERYFAKVQHLSNTKHKALSYALMLLASTSVAIIFTTPFSIYHFQHFSTASLIANLIIVPIAEFAVMPVCFAYTIFAPLKLGFIIKLPAALFTNIMLNSIDMVYNLNLPNLFIHKVNESTLLIFTLLGISLRTLSSTVSYALFALLCFSYCASLGQPYNIVYKPISSKVIQVSAEEIELIGDFSSIERKIIESYFDKKSKTSDLTEDLANLLKGFRKNGLYYIKMREGNIMRYKFYKSTNTPWGSDNYQK